MKRITILSIFSRQTICVLMRVSLLRLGAIVFASFYLAGCAPTLTRVPLGIEHHKTIKKSQLMLNTSQKTIKRYVTDDHLATAQRVGGLAGGLLVGLIVAQERSHVEKTLQPLRDNLVDYQFPTLMNQQLINQLNTHHLFSPYASKVTIESTEKDKQAALNALQKKNEVLIFVDVAYHLNEPLDVLFVTADVEIFKKAEPKAVTIYANQFTYQEKLKRPKEKIEMADLWAKDHAAVAKKSLDSAVRFLSQEIVKDIQIAEIRPDNNLPWNIEYRHAPYLFSSFGYLDHQDGTKYIIRESSGAVIITNNLLIVKNKNDNNL